MKKITYLFILATSLIVSSCSSDDDSGATLSNSMTYGGEEISISSAVIEDYGADFGTYNYDFTFEGTTNDTNYTFYAELFSPIIEGETGFRTGTFNYTTSEPNEPAFFFTIAYIEVNNTKINVDGGKIIVSGAGTNFTFTTDVALANDTSLNISYSGEFQFQ